MIHCEHCYKAPAKYHRDVFGSRELCKECLEKYQNMRIERHQRLGEDAIAEEIREKQP